jgi:hypothetical protein
MNSIFIYYIYRGISVSFFVISINYIMLPNEMNLSIFTIYFVLALLFMALYRNVKPQPRILTCLDKKYFLLGSILSTLILVGYAVFALSLYRFFVSEQYSLGLTLFAALFFTLMTSIYLYHCKYIKRK